MSKKKICIGCENIKNSSFPFCNEANETERKGTFIDTEGCGLVQNEKEYFLEIFYCPVCGKKIVGILKSKSDWRSNCDHCDILGKL